MGDSTIEGLMVSIFLRASISIYITILLARSLAKLGDFPAPINLISILLLFTFQVGILTAPAYAYHHWYGSVDFSETRGDLYEMWYELFNDVFGPNLNSLEGFLFSVIQGTTDDIVAAIGIYTKGLLLAILDLDQSLRSLLPWRSHCVVALQENHPYAWVYTVQTSTICAEYIIGYIRISLLGVFLSTLLFTPCLPFLQNLLLRVIESDKPVFTLFCGSFAALAKSLQEIAKVF